jgi:cell wall-associated NlpC family hydrolase
MAVVATTGAFALPLTGLATAEPAHADILDEIARCESGGNPRAQNPSSSASGTYQFIDSTWRSLGGSGSAKNASPAQQRAMAEKLLASQGTSPWNASKSCWGGKSSSSTVQKRAVPQTKTQRQAAPKAVTKTAPKASTTKAKPRGKTATPNVAGLGVRAADGTGRYVCTQGTLFFDACDPDTLGQIVAYPRYDSRKASSAPTTPVTGRSVAALAQPAASAASSSVVAAARAYLGVPYAWGGTTRAGLDCSGLVQRVLMDRGIAAPRTSAGQSQWVKRISASEARAGDLVFFYSPVSHVGIVTAPGRMIDSATYGTRVQERAIYPGVAWYGRIPG